MRARRNILTFDTNHNLCIGCLEKDLMYQLEVANLKRPVEVLCTTLLWHDYRE